MALDSLQTLTTELGISLWLLVVVIVWIVIWKALALWKSARLNSPVWFVVLLVINTFGILEILYIFLFSKIKLPNVKEKAKPRKRR